MRPFARSGDHVWSQRHRLPYVDGDVPARARRRSEMHAAECPQFGRSIWAIRAPLRLNAPLERSDEIRASAEAFVRVRGEPTKPPAEHATSSEE
jgi:hypothetical protein